MNKENANEFLQTMAKSFNYYKQYEITNKIIYNNLIFYGIENPQESISSNFEGWVNKFKDNPNINTFVSEKWKYFCQFRNDNFTRESNLIKIYIPLDKEHIYEGANQLFDFISKENITHASKIGSQIRFDDIVIRVNSVESANKIQQFVDNNKYIQEGMLQANPFAITRNNIAYGMDGGLSFNETLSEYISEYLLKLKKEDKLLEADIDGLFKYIGDEYVRLYLTGDGISKKTFLRKSKEASTISNLYDHEMITRLLLDGYNKDIGFKAIEDNFNKQKSSKDIKYSYIEKLYNSDINQEKEESKIDIEKEKKLQILEKASLITYRNHGKKQLEGALLYGQEGNYGYFSSAECRKELTENFVPREIEKIAESALIRSGITLRKEILMQYADIIEKTYLEANTITNEEGIANENIEVSKGR